MILLIIVVTGQLFAQINITNTSDYKTMEQMFLANEINESGEPWAEALGYDLDELDPMVPNQPDSISYTLGIEAYEYSRYQLGTIISRSGMGLHMMWSPMIGQMAGMAPDAMDGKFTPGPNGYKEDDVLMGMIRHLGQGAHFIPFKNPWPQFAEFIGGDPHLPQDIAADFTTDFKTLSWDRSKMEKVLNPGAMGQALMKQYLWAQDMLGSFHDENEDEVVPDGISTPDSLNGKFDPTNNIYLGGDNADGFIGQVLTAESINKVLFIINKLSFDGTSLGAVSPPTYNPQNGIRYFPHKIEITEAPVTTGLPPRLNSMKVIDKSSHLFDQLSLLWGTLNFRNLMNPADTSDESHIAYKSVFDGDPFPVSMSETGNPGPFDLMMGASKVLFMNIAAMHFDGANKTFVDISNFENGAVQKGNKISTVGAAYVLVLMKKMEEEFKGTPIEGKPKQMVMAQARFLIDNLKDSSGDYFDSFTIGSGHSSTKSLSAITAAIRGLYAAYELTGINDFLTEADAPRIYTNFSKSVINKMQLSEGGATGETGGDSDGDGIPFITEQEDRLPPVLANEAAFDILNATFDPEFAKETSLKVFPNPFSNNARIDFDLKENVNVTLSLYDIKGQIIKTISKTSMKKGHKQIKLNVNGVSTGQYFLKLRTSEGSTISKVIIN